MAREGGTLRHHPRTLLSLIVVVACVLGTLVVNDAAFAEGDVASPETAINLADAGSGITVVPTVSVSMATDAYTSTGDAIYGNYTTIQQVDGAYDLDPQKYNNEHGAAKYRFTGDFTIPKGALNGRNTLYFDLPAGVNYTEISEPIKDGTQDVGTYTVTTITKEDGTQVGRVTLTLIEEKVQKNENAELRGNFTYELTAGEQANRDGLVWQIPGSRVPVTFGKAYDVHVEKGMEWRDETDVSRPFTIKVASQYGTPDTVTLADKLKNSDVEVEYTNIVVKKNGYASDIECADLHSCVLPKMDAGDSYEITYTATFPESEKDKEFTNVATVETPDGNGGKLTHSSECNFRTPNPGGPGGDPDPKPWIYKQAVDTYVEQGEGGNGEKRMIHWKVTLNENHANLYGWSLNDAPGKGVGNPQNMRLCVRGTNECTTIDKLPYSVFAENDTNTYEFTYSTAYDAATWDDFQKDYGNTVSIANGDQGNESTGTYSVPNPIAKTGGSISGRQEVDSADGASRVTGRVLTWTARINVDHAVDIPAGWTFADSLQPVHWPIDAAHYFTTAQQQEIRGAVKAAFEQAGLAEPTILFLDGNGGDGTPKTRFSITSNNPLPAGKSIEFSYASTTNNPLNNINDPFDFHNQATLRDFSVDASVRYNPNDLETEFTKTDTSGALSSDPNGGQGHASTSLPTENWRPYLTWDINIRPGNELFKQMQESLKSDDPQSLVITETLPKGLELMPAALDSNRTGADGNLLEETESGQCRQDANGADGTDRHCTAGLEIKDTNGPVDSWEASGIRFVRGGDVDGKKTYRLYGNGSLSDTVLATAAVNEVWQDADDDGEWEFDHQQVTIEIKPKMLEVIMPTPDADGNPNVDRWNRQGFTLVLRAGFHDWDPPFTMNDSVLTYDNTVEWSFANTPGTSVGNTVSVYDAQGNIGKEFIGRTQGGQGVLPYQLNMNPKAECLGGRSETDAASCAVGNVTFDDVITYPHIIGYGKTVLTLDRDSVAVYEVVSRHPDGSIPDGAQEFKPTNVSCSWQGCGPYEGDPVAVRKLDASEYSFKVESDHPDTTQGYCYKNECRHDGATWKETLTFDVPNGKNLYIDYAYRMTGDYTDQAWIQVDNSASFAGTVARPSNAGSSMHMETGNASISGSSFSMNKWAAERDANGKLQLTNTRLGGAKFQLYRWDVSKSEFVEQGTPVVTPSEESSSTGGRLTHIGEIVFGGKETAPDSSTEVQFNVAYMLREIEAPEGYEKAPDTYFVFRSGETQFNETTGRQEPVSISAPDGFGVSDDYRNVRDMSVNDGTSAMLDIGDVRQEPAIELPTAGGMTSRWIIAAGVTLLLMSMMGTALLLRREAAIVA